MNDPDFVALAEAGLVIGSAGTRSAPSLWTLRVLPQVRKEADRMFDTDEAKLVAVDCVRRLALFPERKSTVRGEVLDLPYKPIENFFRLRVDDKLFSGRSLRVFFWPDYCTRTIWITGLMWRGSDYPRHIIERQRRRIAEIRSVRQA